jgi:hypothetical protein
MAIDFSNYINTYKGSSVLQQQFPNMNDYLALFGYNQGTTPSAATTSTTPSTGTGVQSIINQNINQFQQGGGGGGGITTLDPYSRQSTKLDPNSFFGKIANQIGGFTDSVYDKFSQSKLGSTLMGGGTKFKNIAFTPMMALANMRNPLNPNAQNYNPSLQGQIDMLEGMTGTKITGTSDNLKFIDNQMMIGRDPNSGLAKYGPGSVLEGQNVVSGFGTNDYIGQLDKYIEKMKSYATLSKFQQAKLDRAIAEKKAAEEKALQEELAKEAAKQKAAQQTAGLSGLTTQGGGKGIASEGVRSGRVDAAGMGGGSRQAKSSGSQNTGRTDGGWGWKEGGSVMSEKEMKKLSETPLYKGFKKMYSVDSSMAKDNPAYSKKYKVFEELYKKGYQKGGLATMFKLKG